MIPKTIEVYSEESNQAVVRMPGRKFPGLVLQGDSLQQLLELVQEAQQHAGQLAGNHTPNTEDLESTLAYLRERIEAYLSSYESTLAAHGIPLPYVKGT